MLRVRLLHWKASEAGEIVAALKTAGYKVEYDEKFESALLREWRKAPPDLFVIDLSRLPSQGKEIAVSLRQSRSTRQVPIVFCQGLPAKVEPIRKMMPDAAFCTAARLTATLSSVLAAPRENSVRPVPMMDRYAGRSTLEKLGVRAGSAIALIDPPEDLRSVLGSLPEDAYFLEEEGDSAEASITLCFIHDADSLRAVLSRLRSVATHSKLWVVWRKKTAPKHAGVTETLVRATGISLGLVDYKICSVNSTWSAMLFALRK